MAARTVLAIGIAALACACGGESDGAGAASSGLAGRVFVSESVEGWQLVPGTQVRLSFHDTELGASAGCNLIDAEYAVQGGVLIVGGYGMTEMGCDAALHAQDDWVIDFLRAKPALELVEPRLTLTTASARMVLLDREIASPDRPLVGTSWKGDGISDGAVVSFGPGMSDVSIRFDASGSVEVNTSCQIGAGAYAVDGASIAFDGLTYDGAPCADPSRQALHDKVIAVLDGAPVTHSIEETRLVIEKGENAVHFRASE